MNAFLIYVILFLLGALFLQNLKMRDLERKAYLLGRARERSFQRLKQLATGSN